jgi:DNA-binding NarL/FixJ family response regulator
MKRITVLLAEDHTIVREGLWTLLKAEAGLEFDTPAAKVASGPIAVLFCRR